MKKHKKMKNAVYIALLAVFLLVVGIRTFQNISLIQKITQNPGIEDASIESNLLIFRSEGEGGCTPCCGSGQNCGTEPCCGTSCGTCSSGYTCNGYSCVLTCTPNCAGKNCGPDGCGGSCGTCASGYACSSGTCISCISNPTVSITPSSQSGIPGQSLIYTINVTNNDNSVCSSTLFSLANTCPSGWTCALSKNSVTIAAQASDASSSITVISATSAQDGSNSFSVTATNQTYSESGTGSATYVVNKNLNCDNHALDNYCSGTENQTACSDCKTTVSMTPNANLIVGQPAQVTIFFSDGRYLANHNVKFTLVINPEGIVWDLNNNCQYGGAILSKDGSSGTTKWPVSTVSNDYNFTITFTCKVPPGLSSGSHTLLVTPTIYSAPISLRAVQVQFTVADNQPDFSSYITSFINAIKSFLGIK